MSSSQLNSMPPELLGKIFGYLPVPDIFGLKLVNCTFRDVVSYQPHLQYKCELAAAGLLDNPNVPGTLFDRRTSLRKYRSAFSGLKPTDKSNSPLGQTGYYCGYQSSGNVFVIHTPSTNRLQFHRPPSASGSRPMEIWSFPLAFQPGNFAVHPPLDLIVVADLLSARLHLMSMATGGLHPLAAGAWVEHDLWPDYLHLLGPALVISVSDHVLAARIQGRLMLWNWRTGAKILDRTDPHGGPMAFIGADCLLVAEQGGNTYQGEVTPRLVLLDVRTLEGSHVAPREVTFVCDPYYHGARVRMITEEAGHSDFPEVMGRDAPFYPDPSRRAIALVFCPIRDALGKAQGVCVVHSETLLSLGRAVGEGDIDWDVWGKYTAAPDMCDVPGAEGFPQYSVSGSRFVRVDYNGIEMWAKVRVYVLSHLCSRQPEVGLGGCEEPERMCCRLIERVLDLPRSMWNICNAAMLQDSLVFFSFDDQHPRWDPQALGSLDTFSFS